MHFAIRLALLEGKIKMKHELFSGVIEMSDMAQLNKGTWIPLLILLVSNVTGAKQVYVHVHRKNEPAQELYRKMGFEVLLSRLCIWRLYSPGFILKFLI